MSHQATAWAYGVRGMTPAQKVVLYHLANRCNERHAGYEHRSICWPSLTRLEADCELSRRGLTQILGVLEGRGIIIRNRRHGFAPARGRGGEATLYELPLHRPPSSLVASRASDVKAGKQGACGASPTKAGKGVPDTREDSTPKPVREPVNRTVTSPVVLQGDDWQEGEFAEFYAGYPRKKAPRRARIAFRSARSEAGFDEIMEGLAAYLKTVRDKKPEFIQHPATWLNGGCWMDRPDGGKGGHQGEQAEAEDARNVYPGLERVVVEFGAAMWNSWLADCVFQPHDDGLHIGAHSHFKADYIRNHFGGRLAELAGCSVVVDCLDTKGNAPGDAHE
jgi:hypothetical protein